MLSPRDLILLAWIVNCLFLLANLTFAVHQCRRAARLKAAAAVLAPDDARARAIGARIRREAAAMAAEVVVPIAPPL